MEFSLPKPCPDKQKYENIISKGLERFPERMENYRKFLSFERNSTALDFLPIKMDYEVTSRCNFRCKMCLLSTFTGGKRAEDLSFEMFKKSLDEMYGLIEIKLQGLGEPLLNPELFDMILYAGERDIWTRTTINGSLLHINENYKRLVDSNPGEVQVSVDGATKEVFESIRIGSNFERIVENVTKLNDYSSLSGKLLTRCWTVVQKSNVHQLEDILRLAHKTGFKRITFSLNISSWGIPEWEKLKLSLEAISMFSEERALQLIELGKTLGVEVTFWNATQKYKFTKDGKQLCQWMFERAFISSDMQIVPCCTVCDPKTSNLGDAKEFSNCWNGEKYMEFRKNHLEGNIPGICRQCY